MPSIPPVQEEPEQKLNPRQRSAFNLAKQTASDVLKRRLRVLTLVRDAYGKMVGHEHAIAKVRNDLALLLRMAKAWAKREYRGLPWKSLVYSVAAIVYFLNPMDLIPDFIAGLGFIDDVAIIGAVVAAIRTDLDDYREWERTNEISLAP